MGRLAAAPLALLPELTSSLRRGAGGRAE